MNAEKPQATRNPRRRWPPCAVALLHDAWVFLTLLVLLVAVFLFLWPLQIVDRILRTHIVAHLINVIERAGDL
jgi:hypothetical protein